MLEKDDALRFYAVVVMKEFTIERCIQVAYLDVCRTLNGFGKHPNKELIKELATESILQLINITLEQTFDDQDAFDTFHRVACDALSRNFGEYSITVGQTQKWINMSLKYVYYLSISDLLPIGNAQKSHLEKNYLFFHIPIDKIVLRGTTVVKRGVTNIRILINGTVYNGPIVFNNYAIYYDGQYRWSGLNDYDQYLSFQANLKLLVKEPLLTYECKIWNNDVIM